MVMLIFQHSAKQLAFRGQTVEPPRFPTIERFCFLSLVILKIKVIQNCESFEDIRPEVKKFDRGQWNLKKMPRVFFSQCLLQRIHFNLGEGLILTFTCLFSF